MKLLLLVLLFTHVRPKSDDNGKIFGGRHAKTGEFPFAVVIVGGVLCGGAVVTVKKVVTAGHCIANYKVIGKAVPRDMSKTRVIGGVVNFQDRGNEAFQSRRIQSYHLHEGFKKRKDGSLFHDIGTIDVVEPFVQTATLAPLPFVSTNASVFKQEWNKLVANNTVCFSMGWGTTQYRIETVGNRTKTIPEKISNALKVFSFTPWDDERCKRRSHSSDNVTMYGEVCGTALKNYEGFCSGDSGSPFICNGHVYGFTTASVDCHDNDLPQTYLLFWYYIDYFELWKPYNSSPHHLIFSPILLTYFFKTLF